MCSMVFAVFRVLNAYLIGVSSYLFNHALWVAIRSPHSVC